MRKTYWVTRTNLDHILRIEPWLRVGKAQRVQGVAGMIHMYPVTMFPDQAAKVQKYLGRPSHD